MTWVKDTLHARNLTRFNVRRCRIVNCGGGQLQFFGVDQAVLVALGALSAVAYVILLERATDDVGSGKRDALTKLRGDARFAMPVILVGLLALKNYLQDPGSVAPLKLVSKEEFTCAIGGFVASSRLPLLFRELRASIKGEDILNILPGSIGQGRQMLNTMGRSDSPGVAASVGSTQQATTTVFMVSSPRVLDRNDLVDQIMREDHRLVAPVWCTTRPLRQAEVADEKLTSLGQMRFEDVDRRGGFLYTYEDERGESYGLRLEDILAVAEKGKVRTCSGGTLEQSAVCILSYDGLFCSLVAYRM